jgi:Na+(H+)/acetate symporter ActP
MPSLYFLFVVGIGWVLKPFIRTGSDFFLSGRSLPAWITGLAFLSANLGAQEVIGMGASGAKYGMMTAHFYWVACFILTILISLLTERRKTDEELRGLVYSLTPRVKEADIPWYMQPAVLGAGVLAAGAALYIAFW